MPRRRQEEDPRARVVAVELDRDGAVDADGKRKRLDSDAALLIGIPLPPKPKPGRPRPGEREVWLPVVERLMARGITQAAALARLTGLAYPVCESLLDTVQRRWADALGARDIALRRAALWSEAEEVSAAAWRDAMACAIPSTRAAFYNIILRANARQAALYGLDTVKIEVKADLSAKEGDMTPAEFRERYGVSREDVEELGRKGAKGLSTAARLTVDVEVAETCKEVADARDGDAQV